MNKLKQKNVRSESVTSAVTTRSYKARGKFCCKSNNLIYLLHCKRCGKQYVGETFQKLGRRIYEHDEHACNTNCYAEPDMAPPNYNHDNRQEATTVARHFGTSPHSWDDVQVQVLEFIHLDPEKEDTTELRRRRESVRIHRLRTIEPFGLNVLY